MNTENKNLMTTTQIAAALGVSYGTIARWRKSGCPYEETRPNVKTPVGSRPLYDINAVKEWYYANRTRYMVEFFKAKNATPREPRQEKLSPYKNISVVSNASFKGCKMPVQKFGVNFTRYFGVSQYKTWEAAEKAALELRDKIRSLLLGKSEREVYKLLIDFRKGLFA